MINLGNDAIDAARSLRETEPWRLIREALAEQMRRSMNSALDAAENHQVAIGYARALRDVYIAFEAATTATPGNRVEKPGPTKR